MVLGTFRLINTGWDVNFTKGLSTMRKNRKIHNRVINTHDCFNTRMSYYYSVRMNQLMRSY